MGDVIEGDGKHAKCSVSNLELLPETPAASGNIPRLVMPSLSLDTESCAASVETGGQSVLSRRETNESRRLNHLLTKFRAITSNSPKTLTGVSEDESVHAEDAPSENDMSSDGFENTVSQFSKMSFRQMSQLSPKTYLRKMNKPSPRMLLPNLSPRMLLPNLSPRMPLPNLLPKRKILRKRRE